MNIDEIVFDTYVICPLCHKEYICISGVHLKFKHGYKKIQDFKIEYGIPMHVALIARNTREVMRKKGKLRSAWFKENVMPIGIEMSKTMGDLVPKEIRKHSGLQIRGRSWQPSLVKEMVEKGFVDIHEAATILGISYNYARKCATDGRIMTLMYKSVRFTKLEWIEDARKLLVENRIKYHKKPMLAKT